MKNESSPEETITKAELSSAGNEKPSFTDRDMKRLTRVSIAAALVSVFSFVALGLIGKEIMSSTPENGASAPSVPAKGITIRSP